MAMEERRHDGLPGVLGSRCKNWEVFLRLSDIGFGAEGFGITSVD